MEKIKKKDDKDSIKKKHTVNEYHVKNLNFT